MHACLSFKMKETETFSTVLIACVILIITSGTGVVNATGESCSTCRTVHLWDWGNWKCSQWEGNYENVDMWTTWENWSGCSRTCGGGVRIRYKYRCCDLGKYQNCKEYSTCPELCLNSGTFDTQCRCTDEFFGECCEEGKPTVLVLLYNYV